MVGSDIKVCEEQLRSLGLFCLMVAYSSSHRALYSMGVCQRGSGWGIENVLQQRAVGMAQAPRAVSMAQSCQSSSCIWTLLPDIGFGFEVVLCGSRGWTH